MPGNYTYELKQLQDRLFEYQTQSVIQQGKQRKSDLTVLRQVARQVNELELRLDQAQSTINALVSLLQASGAIDAEVLAAKAAELLLVRPPPEPIEVGPPHIRPLMPAPLPRIPRRPPPPPLR